ncbi:MAG: hypothetical protein HUJ55_05000 [Ileibacterium sp.]|nr:hypothetical protein [Ileibacterium sp.]MCF0246164.1 hypothetical protein [Ileibacterium sp.]
MIDILAADFSRIIKRRPRLIIYGIIAGLLVLNCVTSKGDNHTLKLIKYAMDMFGVFVPLGIGLLDFTFVFSDDMDSGAFVSIVGRGMKRGRFAGIKLLEAVLLYTMDLAVFNGLTWIFCMTGVLNVGHMSLQMWAFHNLLGWITTVLGMLAGSIFVFATGKMVVGSVVMMLMTSGILEKLLQSALQMPAIANLHIDNWLPNTLTNLFVSKLNLGVVDWTALAVLTAFGVILAGSAVAVFKTRELEF